VQAENMPPEATEQPAPIEPIGRPVRRLYFRPTCGGELVAIRGEVYCLDCPEFAPMPCQSLTRNGNRP
jgi:hypothetical protein